MPNITNVKRAFNQISEKSLAHEGELTRDVFMGFFNHAVGNFNLNEKQVEELKTLSYPVDVMGDVDSSETDDPELVARELNNEDVFLLMDKVESLQSQVEKLIGAVAKIGTLTGYGNHLREFGIERWEPGKKDMNKYG